MEVHPLASGDNLDGQRANYEKEVKALACSYRFNLFLPQLPLPPLVFALPLARLFFLLTLLLTLTPKGEDD